MSYLISLSTIENLGHELDEIRVRTLKHIEGKLLRALEQNFNLQFHSGKLISRLIGWFNKKPLLEIETVLNLILRIVKSEYIHEIIQYIKKARLQKEINKVYELVKDSTVHSNIVIDIKVIIDNYKEPEVYDDSNSSSIPTYSPHSLSIQDLNLENDEFINEYEETWSTPNQIDINSLNMLFCSLSTSSSFAEIKNGLLFFKTAVNDFPAEYFLQPPYIFKNIIKLYYKEKCFAKLLISSLNYLCKAVLFRSQKRWLPECFERKWKESSSDKPKTQITISKFCIEVLKLCTEHLKEFSETIDQNEIFDVFQLILAVFDVMKIKEYKKYFDIASLKSILIDLGVLARFYRQEQFFRAYRIQYILIIFIIAKLENLQSKETHNHNQDTNEKGNNCNNVWCSELQFAIQDFSLKNFHFSVYKEILKAAKLEEIEFTYVKEVLNCSTIFQPAVEILKKPDERKDEDFIILASKALDTLSIHKSLDFVKKVIASISRLNNYFDSNLNLKKMCEEILLRLLSHENDCVKRLSYKETASCMKQSFGALLSGHTNVRSYNSNYERLKTLEIPFSSDILIEIICFGYSNDDMIIKKNAEIILILILKSKEILGEKWKNIQEILIPNFPLLQTLVNYENDLGKQILELFNPDNSLNSFEILKGNLRFLFSFDETVRSEAISRLAYILSRDPLNEEFLPNVFEIFDTIPNNLCCIQVQRDPNKIFYGGVYDGSTIPALLELLKGDDVEPNIRKTCLMQLNVLSQDIDLNKIIFKENGWFYAMQALESSLKKISSKDYPDSTVPAVSMLSKIVLCNSFFRKELSNESGIYVLLIRALFIYYNDITLQQDAVIMLFLLLFSHQIVGAEKQISVPKMLDQINIPLKSDYHWQKSCFQKKSSIEEIYLDLTKNDINVKDKIYCNTMLNNRTNFETNKCNSIPLSRRSEPIYSMVRERISNENNVALLQFMRFTFANIWFPNFDEICANVKTSNSNNENIQIDYSNFQGYLNETKDGVVEISDVMEFNENLKINQNDIRLLKITNLKENLRKYLKKITNATSKTDFLKGLAGLKFCLLLGADKYLDGSAVIKIFQRFLCVKPNNDDDSTIFENSIEFIEYLIKHENENVICWLLKELSQQYCLILEILKDYNFKINLYHVVCKLIETLIKYCFTKCCNNKIKELILQEIDKTETKYYNLYNKLFEYIIPIAEECFHKRKLDQFRRLLNILKIITETKLIEVDIGFINVVIKKLMYFMIALKLFYQSGSHLNKNCLMIIGNLTESISEFILDENYIKLLSGLCSHEDYEIRALSWCVLNKVSINLNGAHLIIKELSYLPGGFHACCLSTFLDCNEVPIVRSTAGILFANLLSHTIKNSDGVFLHMSVVPLCVELEPSTQNDGIYLVKQILNKYRFYSTILSSIEYFYISNQLSYLKIQNITTPQIISAYCRILSNFFCLNSESLIEEVESEPFMMKIFNLIKLVPSCITYNSLAMLSDICFLINKFYMNFNIVSIRKNLSSDYGFVIVLIQLLDISHFENQDTFLVNIIQTLKLLVNETISFDIICEVLSASGAAKLVDVIVHCLKITTNIDLQNVCLTFLISLFVQSDNISNNKCNAISQTFDNTIVSDASNNICCGTERIFQSIDLLFDRVFKKKKNVSLLKKTLVCEALAILLKTSKKVKIYAHAANFMRRVLQQIESIFENITITCSEFIRKYGDSKKDVIVQELNILYSIILFWFCSDCLTNENDIEKLSKIALQTWQWINHSESLCETFLKTLAVVSENSLQVCKQFASSITNFSNSIVQLTTKMIIAETNKMKHPNIDFGVLEIGLGILINCCCCIEGRMLLVKLNVLETISHLHPIDMKILKTWNIVAIYWLEFWNVFSRHQEGAVIKHLYILCSLIAKTNNKVRMICLKILQNMVFFHQNRPALLSSQDFQFTIKEMLDRGNEEERYVVIIMLWKLSADNFKAKHTIKNWNVLNKLRNIQNEIEQIEKENDLNSAIEILLDILK